MIMELLGCCIFCKEVQCLLQDWARFVIIHWISRLYLLYRVSNDEFCWSFATVLNPRSDSCFSLGSCNRLGEFLVPAELSPFPCCSFSSSPSTFPAMGNSEQCLRLKFASRDLSCESVWLIPVRMHWASSIPFDSHVLHQQPQHVFNYPITTKKYSFGVFFGL